MIRRLGWHVFAESVRGTSHVRAGLPGQDANYWQVDNSGRFVAAVADGAGFAEHGGRAAKIASRVAVEAAIWRLRRAGRDTEGALRHALREVHAALKFEADRLGCSLDLLATTLILMVARADEVGVVQVGDGFALAVDADDKPVGHSLPQGGEFANETVFVNSPDAVEKAQSSIWPGKIAAAAIISDGLQRLALKMPDMDPHRPFFDRIFRAGDATPEETQRQLANLLSSTRVQEKTDDDLTLVVVWNHSAGNGLLSDGV